MEIKKLLKTEGNSLKLRVMISGLVLLMLSCMYAYYINSRYISTDDAYIQMGISSISPQISGVIDEVKVKNNHRVKKDDEILIIDKTPWIINVQSAKANLANVANQIQNLKSGLKAKRAELENAKINLEYYQKLFNRAKELKDKNTISQAEFDSAKRQLDNSIQSTKNIAEVINQQLASLDGNADLPIEKHSLYLEAKAKLDKANFDLENTVIKAPFDGIVSNLYLKKGKLAVQNIPLFSIVDDNDVWVEANLKETQFNNLKPGQSSTIEVDAYPKHKLKAKVVSITPATGSEFSILPAQNSSGNWVKVTQRIMVRLELKNYDHKLFLSSGMSVIVNIDTKSL